jgi:hypothetical protein
LGSPRGYLNLGILYEFGEDIEQDYSKALEFYEKACEMGDSKGCELYKKLKEKLNK